MANFFDKLASFLNDENKYKLKKVQYLESNSEYLTTEQKIELNEFLEFR